MATHSLKSHRISSDTSQDPDDNQTQVMGSPGVQPQGHSQDYEPSSVTGHEPVIATASVSDVKSHGAAPEFKGERRSSYSESDHEDSVGGLSSGGDNTKHRKKKKRA